MRSLASALVVTIALFAGCTGSSEPTETDVEEPMNAELPDFKPVEPSVDQDVPATLDAAPQWKQGEWWKIRLVDTGFQGKTFETTRIVVGQEGDHYLVGMPAAEFSDDFMLFHVPGFGQVAKENLSFEVHNVNFEPVRFPVKEGATWETAFEGRHVTAKVMEASGTQARIQMDGANDHMNITYDTTIHEIVKYDAPAYVVYEVIEHGYNYTGLVTVPHMHQLVFQHFRIAGALSGVPAAQPSITDTINIDSTYDRVSFGIIFVALAGPSATGYFHEKDTSPTGEVYELTVMPGDPGVAIKTVGQDKPGGRWTLEHTAGGAGIIGAEGIAYHTYNVEMPSGHIQASTGEHKHGG